MFYEIQTTNANKQQIQATDLHTVIPKSTTYLDNSLLSSTLYVAIDNQFVVLTKLSQIVGRQAHLHTRPADASIFTNIDQIGGYITFDA